MKTTSDNHSVVRVFLGLLAAAAAAGLLLTAGDLVDEARDRPVALGAFLAVSCLLQLLAVRFSERGAVCASAVGLIAVGLTFGVGAAMGAGVLAGLTNTVRRRAPLSRAVFNAATLALAAGAAAALAVAVDATDRSAPLQVLLAVACGAVYWLVNIGALSTVMSLSEHAGVIGLWRERLSWLTPYYPVFGLLAVAAANAYEHAGLAGFMGVVVLPAALMLRASLTRATTRASAG